MEFIQVTDSNTCEKYLINLDDISFFREREGSSGSIIKLKSEELTIQVKESFKSFEDFFEKLGEL